MSSSSAAAPPLPCAASAASCGRGDAGRHTATVRALLRANARYWASVASRVNAQLTRWERRARSISDADLRAAALAKLSDERFNVEVAATFATLAPRLGRASVVEATVALQVAYDYLDLLTEPPLAHGEQDSGRLLGALAVAVDAEHAAAPEIADGEYLQALTGAIQGALVELPSAPRVLDVARSCAHRCAVAQTLEHASVSATGEQALRRWARRSAAHGPLGWREYAAGASASVLCLHALLAAAAQPQTHARDAAMLDRLYLEIGALTMLDSMLDEQADRAVGARSWKSRYRDEHEMARALSATAAQARNDALQAHDGAHHLVMLAGVIAYYASARPAGLRRGDPVASALRAELRGALSAPLLVMRLWRTAKAVRLVGRRSAGPSSVFSGQARRRRMSWRQTPAMAAVAAVLLAAISGVQQASGARIGHRHRRAVAASALKAHDVAKLHYVSASGATLYEVGAASGTLPGGMQVHMRLAATFSGNFVIHAREGSIAGHGSATPHGSGVYESFAGTLIVTGGTGRFRHAHGKAGLYGVFDRKNYSLTVKTIGTLHY